MNAHNRGHGHHRGRRRTPHLETLEVRDLPSVLIAHHAVRLHPAVRSSAAVQGPAPAAQAPARQMTDGLMSGVHADATTGTFASPTGVAHVGDGITSVNQGIPGTATAPPPDAAGGLPTAHEVARQTFVGRFKGNYVIGPGRYTDQARALTSLGYGGSNQAFHLWTNMRIAVPTDPTAPADGVIYIIPWTVGTTGTQLFLDLKGDQSTAVNGIPTHYTWTVDPGSSGLYANVGGQGTGQGTLDIKFFRPGPGDRPGTLQGQLQFAINGFINVSGVANVIGVLGNLPHETTARSGVRGTPRLA